MSPLVITIVLVFTAGAIGFFFGCMFASWLGASEEAKTLPSNQDLAPNAATPTASDPSTFIMSYPSKASDPAVESKAPAQVAEEPVHSETRTPAPQEESSPPGQDPAPQAATNAVPSAATPSPAVASTQSSAAGSANPSVTPLRGPLAIARATTKDEEPANRKPAKTPRRRKSGSKPAASKKKPSGISIAASKPKAAAKSTGTPKPKPAAKTTEMKPAAAMPGETQAKKPRFLPKPRKGGADDLKRIKGVGPSLEATLNGLGVFHYNQVSKWTPENVMWIDDHLKFKGRIARDNWLEQAAKLEAGEVTEFASRVDKGAVASSKGKSRRKRT